MSEESKEKPIGGDPIEATSTLPPMEYTPSEKEQAILDKITENNMVLLSEMNQIEVGSLGKLKQRGMIQIRGHRKTGRYACLIGWVEPPPEPEEE